ncbi:hypothetical protein [Companilactobacillus sp. HBUAS59699]|uniref:hypothetical protein n=1 Tax=Companilactobacillus sp. HBUAS59699 TaxID=3109358 RepID=UPI002FEEC573
MTEETTNINDILAKTFDVKVHTYNYSKQMQLIKDGLINCFTNENWRMNDSTDRFELIDLPDHFSLSGNLNLDDFEDNVDHAIKSGRMFIDYSTRVSDQDLTAWLVQKASEKGFIVYGYVKQGHDINEILDDKLFIRALKKSTQTDYSQFVTVNEVNNTFTVDLEYNHVMKKLDDEELLTYDICYSIFDDSGNVAIYAIPSDQIDSVLYSLIIGVDPQSIKSALLYPKITKSKLASSQLLYERAYRSWPIEVTSAYDIENFSYEVPEGNDLIDDYYFNDSVYNQGLNAPFSSREIVNVLDYLYHDIDDPKVAEDQTKLTNELIKMADEHDLIIYRSMMQETAIGKILHITMNDQKISGYEAHVDEAFGNKYMARSVFDVVKKDHSKVVKYDLTISQLFTYLLSLNPQYQDYKKSIEEED